MVVQRLTQITPPAATPYQLWQRVEAACSAVPQEHIQSLFESMPRRVAEEAGFKEFGVCLRSTDFTAGKVVFLHGLLSPIRVA
ncbi:hypothetical protein TNCV_2311231 [Trichonephila clavipes]|nr:hypothetical protein TNCV_2311231 [Trichonephila clavipes]